MLISRFSGAAFIASLSLVVTLVAGPTALAQPTAAGHKVASLEIKILSTMLADEGFGEWGFAALVEVDGRKILFDTGAHDDTVQRNLKAMGLDLSAVAIVILSHNHDDHTTGLLPLRRQFAARSPAALSKVLRRQRHLLPAHQRWRPAERSHGWSQARVRSHGRYHRRGHDTH